MNSHFLSIGDWKGGVQPLLDQAVLLKRQFIEGRMTPLLAGKTLGLIFEKPSTRTRVSFEVGMFHLGGNIVTLKGDEIGFNKRESVADIARVLSRYVDGVIIRSYFHHDIVEFAQYATVPIINGLSDGHHPCQALADALTILEHKKRLDGVVLAYIGDGNNVCVSLLELAAATGMVVRVGCPPGYEPPLSPHYTAQIFHDPRAAVEGADVVYTDVWTSMGQEEEAQRRLTAFAAFQVNEALMAVAAPDAIFMHCLPAHRGEEVTHGVLESPQSVVFDQAENRMHAQKAVLVNLLHGGI
jgi:ornithine carbamoyltransferase